MLILLPSLPPLEPVPPPSLCQAVYPHRQADGGAEGVPERLLLGAPVCAAGELRQRQGASADLRVQARGQSVDRDRIHHLRAVRAHHPAGALLLCYVFDGHMRERGGGGSTASGERTSLPPLVCVVQDKLMTSSYSPVLTTKAVKDETEQRILREAHVRARTHHTLTSALLRADVTP